MFGSKDLLFSSEQYGVAKSLRFRSSASAYLSRTPASNGDRQKFTWSGWVKRGALSLSTPQVLFSAYNNSGTTDSDWFRVTYVSSGGGASTDALQIDGYLTTWLRSSALYRDPSAWHHVVVAVDTTSATTTITGTSTDRIRLYVNGAQITAFNLATAPTQNLNTAVNSTSYQNRIGSINYTATPGYFDGYLAEVNFIDGQALTPSSFGFYDNNGIWQPKGYTGTYGTNGFYLKFTDVGATSGANSGYGKDFSGFNTNYYTTNNFGTTSTATTYDSMYDSPVNASNGITGIGNYAVLNPLDTVSVTSLTEANLYASLAASASANVRSSLAVTSGKWYWEVTFGSTGDTLMVGVCDATVSNANSLWSTSNSWMYYSNNGNKYGAISGAYGATFTNGDIIGVALDLDNGTLVFYKNNISQGTAASSGLIGRTLTPTIQSAARALTAYGNFGQRPFAYTPPSGFAALNTQNLTTPTITNGAAYMAATTYIGNGSTQNITNGGNNSAGTTFQPDFVWIKGRSTASDNGLSDVLRNASGLMYVLYSNSTSAESLGGAYVYYPTLSNGFTVTNNAGSNQNLSTYVAWQWNAGGAPTTDNVAGAGNVPTAGSVKINGANSTSTLAGSIAATRLSANTSAGFSVVTYTGTGANATVGHGLGVAPSMIIVKDRDLGTAGWCVFHTSSGAGNYLLLNGTAANTASTVVWNNTAPDSSKFALGAFVGSNANGDRHVAYCFAPVAGYSAFGSYTGNGSTDGPFVYTGFRPRWILWKRSDGTPQDWFILDTSRDTYNQASLRLCPDLTNAEASSSAAYSDILSNGFKVRSTDNATNASGGTYIYAAFAENPFRIARAR